MAADRRPGSNSGRPAIDWAAAFAYYSSLPDPERSYQAVADEFAVSVRTVERHGRDERWKQRLREVKREAAVALNEELTARQMHSLKDALKLAEATYTRYAQRLQAGAVKVTPSDLARMVALQAQITETIATLATAADGKRVDEDEPDERAGVEHRL